MKFTNRTCNNCKLPHYRCKKTIKCKQIKSTKKTIDPIDRLIASINQREKTKKEAVPSRLEIFFKKYDSLYDFYKRQFPYEDPLTKVCERIDTIKHTIKEEEVCLNLNKLHKELKGLTLYAKILSKGLDYLGKLPKK